MVTWDGALLGKKLAYRVGSCGFGRGFLKAGPTKSVMEKKP